jgi:hypothetical protein
MSPARSRHPLPARSSRGQIIVIAAIGMIAFIGMVAVVLEGGNAYAQQRVTQNASDGAANAGAVVLAQRLAGVTKDTTDVAAAIDAVSPAGPAGLDIYDARYTDVAGNLLTPLGVITTNRPSAALVGTDPIPGSAQGVSVAGTRNFDTFFARVFGFTSFKSTAEAIAVAGSLQGGAFLPIVFPINVTDCEVNGDLVEPGQEVNWQLSQPGNPPTGPEYIVPLCKPAGGAFQVLDLVPGMKCEDEVTNKINVSFILPQDVEGDPGNDCAKKIFDALEDLVPGGPFLIPICDSGSDEGCASGGGGGTYHIVKVASFWIDYVSDQNSANNPACKSDPSKNLYTIAGNGSSSCVAGWFVRYISAGAVGTATVGTSDAIGVQLIK